MELRGVVIATGTVIVTVQPGLLAWLGAGIGALTEPSDRAERAVAYIRREVACVRGQPSFALPSLAESSRARTEGEAARQPPCADSVGAAARRAPIATRDARRLSARDSGGVDGQVAS